MVYRWMLAGGLNLKGIQKGMFALIFSYTRSRHVMFESEISLAKCFGYKRESINVALKELIKKGLVVRLSRHKVLQTYDYCVNIYEVARMLGPPRCQDPSMLNAFQRSIPKQTLEWCEKILHKDVRKPNIPCEKSSQPGVRKSHIACEEILHYNNKDKKRDNIKDNDISTLSKDLKEILLPIFFFKNNCSPISEMNRFIDYYQEKGWKLGGGKVIACIEELMKIAESWTVKEQTETCFHPSFIRGWKELYKEAPESLKMDFLNIKTPIRGQTSSTIICSQGLRDWLNEKKEMVEQIFTSHAAPNYNLKW